MPNFQNFYSIILFQVILIWSSVSTAQNFSKALCLSKNKWEVETFLSLQVQARQSQFYFRGLFLGDSLGENDLISDVWLSFPNSNCRRNIEVGDLKKRALFFCKKFMDIKYRRFTSPAIITKKMDIELLILNDGRLARPVVFDIIINGDKKNNLTEEFLLNKCQFTN